MNIKNIRIKRELGQNLTHTVVPSSIIVKNNISSTNFSDNSVLSGGAEWYAPPYLTNTNNCTSTPVKKSGNFDGEVDFSEESLNLYFSTKDLFENNKKGLQSIHSIGFQRFKMINPDNVVLYTNCNPFGNTHNGWNDSHKESNSNKAQYASKNRFYEKALANSDIWEYFVTITFDPKKKDRYNFVELHRTVKRFFQRRNVKYGMVAEPHKNGAIHFHALCSAELGPFLKEFEVGDKASRTPFIAGKLKKGEEIYYISDFRQRFGYNTVAPCRSKEKCVNYMSKYILKSFENEDFVRFSHRRFFFSTGLKNPEIVLPDSLDFDEFEPVAYGKFCPKVYLKRIEIPEHAFIDNPPSH